MTKIFRVLAMVCAVGIMTVQLPVHAQEKVRVLSDTPLQPALIQIGEAFRRDTGNEVEFVFGPSPVVHKKIADGETADVVILQPEFVDELVKAGKAVPGQHPLVGRLGFGLASRAGASSAMDFATTAGFKQALLNADSLIFNNLASGDNFAKVLERLGIAEAVKAKVVRLDPRAVYDRVIQGKGNDVAVMTLPLIKTRTTLRLLGPLPPELQIYIVYAAASITSATSRQAGKVFIDFLSSPAAKAMFAANGVE